MADRRFKLLNAEPQEAPKDGNSYVRSDGEWVLEGSTSGVVTSVFGRAGAVVAAVGDYSAFYAPLSHTHVEADITDLGSYSVVGHGHTEADISDLQDYLLASDSPTLTGAWNFDPAAAATVPLTLNAHTSQTANISEVYDGAGTLRHYTDPAGYKYDRTGFKQEQRLATDAQDFISTYWQNDKGALDEKIWMWEGDASDGLWSLRHCKDDYTAYRYDVRWIRNGGETETVIFGDHTGTAPKYGVNADGGFSIRGDAEYDSANPYEGQAFVFDTSSSYAGGGVYSGSTGLAWWELQAGGKTTAACNANANMWIAHVRGDLASGYSASQVGDETGSLFFYGKSDNLNTAVVGGIYGMVDLVPASNARLGGGIDIRRMDGATGHQYWGGISAMRFKYDGEIITGTGTYFTGDNEFVGLRLADSGQTDWMDLAHDGTDLNANFTNTANFNFLDGIEARVYDSGNTDYIGLEHNGTDGRITTTDNVSIGVGGTGDVEMRYAGTVQTRTQDGTATGNNSGLTVRHNNNSLYNIGFMEEPWQVVNSSLASTQAAWEVYVGQTIYSNDASAYTYTLPPSTNTFPNGTWWNITNTGSANITITPGSGTSLVLMDGSASTGSRTLAAKGFCRVYRRTNAAYYMIHFGGVT